MAIRDETTAGDGANAGEGSASQRIPDIMYIMHPNCAIEDV